VQSLVVSEWVSRINGYQTFRKFVPNFFVYTQAFHTTDISIPTLTLILTLTLTLTPNPNTNANLNPPKKRRVRKAGYENVRVRNVWHPS